MLRRLSSGCLWFGLLGTLNEGILDIISLAGFGVAYG